MIHFERTLPELAAIFKKLVHQTVFNSEQLSWRDSKARASSVSKDADGGTEGEDRTVLVPGLTWAETVDLTPW